MAAVTADLAITLDGYAAGTDQRLDKPFGDLDHERLHRWVVEHGDDNGAGVAAVTQAAAYLIGLNMFAPGRGDWDLDGQGWCGEQPPYHAPVVVLTHRERAPPAMRGGTTVTVVTGGLGSALEQARVAAGSGGVAIAGGAMAIDRYLAAGGIDELRLRVVPFAVGAGSRIFDGVPPLDLEVVCARRTPHVTHLTYRRS